MKGPSDETGYTLADWSHIHTFMAAVLDDRMDIVLQVLLRY